jgi:hypothetical protein
MQSWLCSFRFFDLAVGEPPGDVGQHLPIPPHITEAGTHRAEPIYLCRVVRNVLVRSFSDEVTEGMRQSQAVSFESTLYVGLKPYDN